MILKTQIITAAGLLLTATAASGHSGHEVLGNGVHVEYLLAISVASILAIYALVRHKRDGRD